MKIKMTEEQQRIFVETYYANVNKSLLHRRANAAAALQKWREAWGLAHEYDNKIEALAHVLLLPEEERWHYPLGAWS
jgi:hypothetical protein